MVEEKAVTDFLNCLNSYDVKEKVEAIKRTSIIMRAVGPEVSIKILLNALEEFIESIEDEVIWLLCQELPTIFNTLGSEYLKNLLPILEKLLKHECTHVREAAIISMKEIGLHLNDEQMQTLIFPFVNNLVESDWFTGKCSASALFEFFYPSLTMEQRITLRNHFKTILQEDSPLVRRTASLSLESFINVVEKDYVNTDFVPLFSDLTQDDQDSVRLLSVNVGISIATRLTPNEIEELILEKLMGLGSDVSWRIKYRFASQINNIQRAIGSDLTRKHLVPIFYNLSQDSEAQVREEIAKNIAEFCEQLQATYDKKDEEIDPVITTVCFSVINKLDNDKNETVVEQLALNLLSISKLLGKKYSQEFLLPKFSNKVSSDSKQIKECVVMNVNQLINIIGYCDVAKVIQDMMHDLKCSSIWRTRRNLYVTLNSIIQHVDSEHFNKHFLSIYASLLNDCVAAVRRTGTLLLPLLINRYGFKWAYESLIPILSDYLYGAYNYKMMYTYSVDEIIKPFLQSNNLENYLLKHKRQLNEINILCKMLGKAIDEINSNKNLEILESAEYFNDNILTYTENIFTEIHYNNNLKNNEEYLLISLKLILTTFMTCLIKLAENEVANVQLRATNTLQNICLLWIDLNNLLTQSHIKEILNESGVDEKDNIESDVKNFIEEHKFKELTPKHDCSQPMEVDTGTVTIIKDEDIEAILEECEEKLIFDVKKESHEETECGDIETKEDSINV